MGRMRTVTYSCERCGTSVTRESGRQGRGRFCSIACGRAAQPMPPLADRFWAKVAKGEGCWEWQGSRGSDGYGRIRIGSRTEGRVHRTHRVSWELANGPIPDGLVICHRCDNPPCVRPDHLFLGTPTDNTADRDRKGRGAFVRGDQHPQRLHPEKVLRGEQTGRAKLTEAQVREIRIRRAAGERLGTLAVEFDVRSSTISHIATRRIWRHVQ